MEVVANLGKDRLLIVGGTGFIGTHIAKEALVRGFKVSIISMNNKPSPDRLDGIEYLSIDISLQEDLFNKIKDKTFHHVINLGGYINHGNYFEGGNKVIDVHFNGVKNLVNCINKNDLKSFIQIGSSDEYGKNSAPQNENQRELPISSYSFAKTAVTHFLQMLYRTEGFPVVILRPFLVYGPGQDKNRFIPQIVRGCLNNNNFPVSSGAQLRDFCYISDIVNAIFASVGNKNTYGEVVNIASGRAASIKSVVIMVRDIIGSGYPEFGKVESRIGESMELYADISKAKTLLYWTPRVNLKEGLMKTISSIKV